MLYVLATLYRVGPSLVPHTATNCNTLQHTATHKSFMCFHVVSCVVFHVLCASSSCVVCFFVMCCVLLRRESLVFFERHYMSASHESLMCHSCVTHVSLMCHSCVTHVSLVWMHHVTHVNASTYNDLRRTPHMNHYVAHHTWIVQHTTHESCNTPHMNHVTHHIWIMSRMWMHQLRNESCHTQDMSHVTRWMRHLTNNLRNDWNTHHASSVKRGCFVSTLKPAYNKHFSLSGA